jgi:hypothetical protein
VSGGKSDSLTGGIETEKALGSQSLCEKVSFQNCQMLVRSSLRAKIGELAR